MIKQFGAALAIFSLIGIVTVMPAASAASVNFALGDSRASGLGLSPMPNATQQDTDCGRSPQAYSGLAAAQAGATNYNFACSGATLYGVWDQIMYSRTLTVKPNYVTLTAGANDVGWSQWITDCKTKANCGGSATETKFQQDLITYKNNLNTIIKQINLDLMPGQILVAGYGPLFGTDKSCGVPYGITTAEATTIDNRVAALDNMISQVAAGYAAATYVPISFNGQGVCTANGPIQPFTSSVFAHPTLSGSQTIATQVLAKVR